MRYLPIAALLCLTACGDGGHPKPPPPPSQTTITDPMVYLADPAHAVRYDIGHYQASTAYQIDQTHAVVTWDYPDFGVYSAATGDGGEQYAVEGDTIRIEGTRDGGKPYNQYFTGKDCGGTGWLIAKTNAPRGAWGQTIAQLGISQDPAQCSAGSMALTRYGLWYMTLPVVGVVEVLVSEHYDGPTVELSRALERSFFYHGRLVWQAFSANPPAADLSTRCPDFGWQFAPVSTMHLTDCRISVNSEGTAGTDLWRLGR